MHARQQLVDREGFGQIVVRPAIQSVHPVGHRLVPGEQEHRSLAPARAPTPQQLVAIRGGNGPVEDNQVVGIDGKELIGGWPVDSGVDRVMLSHQDPLDEA